MPYEAETTINTYAQIHVSVRPEVKRELVQLSRRTGESIAALLTRLIREEAERLVARAEGRQEAGRER